MDFTTYDIILLVIFVLFVSFFLYRRRKNIKREGLLLLYKTSLGVKIIDRIGKKYRKTLNALGGVSIVLGFLLMLAMLYFFGRMVWLYVFQGDIVRLVKVPPITPLLPYLPQIFKLNFLPPFYFIYWIVIIAIVAIVHEFSHGVFAANKGVRIKSTGFGFFPFFLPVFLAAFVELDEKKMEKKKISSQLAVLSSGTFANFLTAALFFGILVLFFSLAFTPSGVVFDSYTYSAINLESISSVNGLTVNNATYSQILGLVNNSGKALTEVTVDGIKYLATSSFLSQQKGASDYLLLYDNAPAINANLSNIIIKVNGASVTSKEQLGKELLKYAPGEKVTITTLFDDSDRDYEITLGKSPIDNSRAYLGVGFINRENSGLFWNMIAVFTSFRVSEVYYKPSFQAAEFIYNWIWWLVLVCLSVALVNMLPVGIFDGGRFFFLLMLAITKDREKTKKIFSIVTYFFLFLLLVIMIFWGINLFR
jgi:membrane-associated protease RseP (regulator of RpoE activity)